MKKLTTYILLFSLSSIFSQNRETKFSFKTNGYYYTKNKNHFKKIINLKKNNFKVNDSLYSVNAFIFKKDLTLSTSDDFIGVFHGKKNTYETSIEVLEFYLLNNSSFHSKGIYNINKSKFRLSFKNNSVKFEGKFINKNDFIFLNTNNSSYNSYLNKVYQFKPYKLKEEIYYDENLNEISLKEFNNTKSNFILVKKTDNSIKKISIKTEKHGSLNKKELKLFKNYLSKITKTITNNEDIIVLNFNYSFDCHCQYFLEYVKKYKRKIMREKNVKQFFISNNNELPIYKKKHIKSYLDQKNIIKQLFDKNFSDLIKYIIIKPNGDFYLYRGRYNYKSILENLN